MSVTTHVGPCPTDRATVAFSDHCPGGQKQAHHLDFSFKEKKFLKTQILKKKAKGKRYSTARETDSEVLTDSGYQHGLLEFTLKRSKRKRVICPEDSMFKYLCELFGAIALVPPSVNGT